MEQAWRSGHVRIVTVSAVVLAAAAVVIVLGARAGPADACGCDAGSSCSRMADGPGPERAPFSGMRLGTHVRHADDRGDVRHHAFPLPLDGDGFVLKLSFYRGLGGGVASSFTRDGLALTFEGGAGVGGSFSAGSAVGRPHTGLGFEARASTSGRLYFLRPPDFGLTLSRNGMARGYVDAKTGNFRTRFKSRPISLTGGRAERRAEAPVTRRSWSLGTEFKVAAGYTVVIPWGGLLDLWTGVFGTVPGRAPPAQPADLLGCVRAPSQAVVWPCRGVDLRRADIQAALAVPSACRGRSVPTRDRRTRFTAPDALDPAGSGRGAFRRPDIGPGDLEIRHYRRSAN